MTTTATINPTTTVGQLVAERPSRSRVFEQLGIDYCCGGKKPLADICAAKGLSLDRVVAALEAADVTAPAVDPDGMTLTALCDHIEATHHAYLRVELPRLGAMLDRVSDVHGQHHPWVPQVRDIFAGFVAELNLHMVKEEQILFPIIRQMEAGHAHAASHCGSIQNPIAVMEHEHAAAGDALEKFRQLSSDYTPPEGACNTFRAMLAGLAELEANMHQHVHKENNILFPKAIKLEAGPSCGCSH